MKTKDTSRCGTILGLSYQFPSGIAMMFLRRRNGEQEMVYVESGCGLRALASCFGAREGSGDLAKKIVGREIRYNTDFMGVMEWFAPVKRGRKQQ